MIGFLISIRYWLAVDRFVSPSNAGIVGFQQQEVSYRHPCSLSQARNSSSKRMYWPEGKVRAGHPRRFTQSMIVRLSRRTSFPASAGNNILRISDKLLFRRKSA
jgi:hypothetical protein